MEIEELKDNKVSEITECFLDGTLMPNGEFIHLGKVLMVKPKSRVFIKTKQEDKTKDIPTAELQRSSDVSCIQMIPSKGYPSDGQSKGIPIKSIIQVIQRIDGRVEGICEHGIGHTIRVPEEKEGAWRHGCDGCCKDWKRYKPDERIPDELWNL